MELAMLTLTEIAGFAGAGAGRGGLRAADLRPRGLSPADPRRAVERGAVAHRAHPASSRSWRPQQLLRCCPAQSACIAAGGLENDGPGAKTLTEQWRGGPTSTARAIPAAFAPRADHDIAACIRAATSGGAAIGAPAARLEPKINAPIPQRTQPMSEVERITSRCSAT